ncbi:type II toxin-antitoxin system ParD family antitoxin [Arboricoccus pini]|nr:type II toxin-antitoxin system ParD family antitoxin [Arboricoccus pini]
MPPVDLQLAETLPAAFAHLAAGPLAEALGKAVGFAQASLAPRAEKAYGDTWNAFRDWCALHRVPALPAAPAIVAAYLAARQDRLGRSGLRLVLAAIAHHHRRAGLPWTAADPAIATVMHGVLRSQKRPVRPAAALTSTEIKQLLAVCDDRLIGRASLPGLRDRALLLMCFAGGLRRAELVALDHEDIAITKDGLTLRIRHAKGDQEGEGASVLISRGRQEKTCPVRAMEVWLQRSRIAYGPVFPRLTATGTIEGRLSGNGLWRILRRRAAQAGQGRLTISYGVSMASHQRSTRYDRLIIPRSGGPPINISISLTPELLGLIKARVDSGRYTSSSEVVREALRLLERADEREAEACTRLRQAWDDGIASGDSGPSTSLSYRRRHIGCWPRRRRLV